MSCCQNVWVSKSGMSKFPCVRRSCAEMSENPSNQFKVTKSFNMLFPKWQYKRFQLFSLFHEISIGKRPSLPLPSFHPQLKYYTCRNVFISSPVMKPMRLSNKLNWVATLVTYSPCANFLPLYNPPNYHAPTLYFHNFKTITVDNSHLHLKKTRKIIFFNPWFSKPTRFCIWRSLC